MRKISQKVQPVFNKVKQIINPCNALLGFLIKRILNPTLALAAPNPIYESGNLNVWIDNVCVAILVAAMFEETTYRASSMIPGSGWFNSRTGAPLAVVGAYGRTAGAYACHRVGWHNKGWKCMSGTAACTGYVIGSHRAAPTNPILTASRAAMSPFEVAKEAEMGDG